MIEKTVQTCEINNDCLNLKFFGRGGDWGQNLNGQKHFHF